MAETRITKADLALLAECRRSKGAFTDERVLFWSEYRRHGSIRTYRLVNGDSSEIVTRRVKRLLSMGLVEHDLFLSNYGPEGDVVLTEAGRNAIDAAAIPQEGASGG